MSQSRPVLVLLPEASASEQVGRLQSAYRVLTLLRPRIVVLDVDEQALTALRKTPDVLGVYEQDVPPELTGEPAPGGAALCRRLESCSRPARASRAAATACRGMRLGSAARASRQETTLNVC